MRTIASFLALVLLLLPTMGSASESADGLLERGLALYEAGDYPGAVDVFNEVLAAGVDDPVVHYDLANAWFKTGRLGFAIYHYRRAHALAPRDEDVNANLEYARFLALDSITEEARTDTRVEGWLDRITPEEASRVPAVLWILAGLAAVVWQLRPSPSRLWRRSATVLVLLWAGSMVLGVAAWRRSAGLHEGVVLAREVVVRNGPGDSFETAFVLHEGAEVVVEGERGSWTEVSLPGELRGWLPSDQLARL